MERMHNTIGRWGMGNFKIVVILTLLVSPLVTHAEPIDSLNGIQTFFNGVQNILDVLLPILVTLAVIVFFWGLVKYVYSAGNEKMRADGAALMTWGVIALFVMVSIWGLVEILQNLFDIDSNAQINVPTVPSI